jgi:hypothetical protein
VILQTVVEWAEGDICDDKRKMELAYGREQRLMVVSRGRIGHYLFYVSANRDVGQ